MDYTTLVMKCRNLKEGPCLEFKTNNTDPSMIGKDISALSNSALIEGVEEAFMIWGIEDKTHSIVGTTFDPDTAKIGNENMFNWLRRAISPDTDFFFTKQIIDDKQIVILTITPPAYHPSLFNKMPYIRIGSCTKLLSDSGPLENKLWDSLNNYKFELRPVSSDLSFDEVKQYLNCDSAASRLSGLVPSSDESLKDLLIQNRIITEQMDGRLSITTMGALLFSDNLNKFEKLCRKTIRIVQYEGNTKASIRRQIENDAGYALQFENTIRDISLLLSAKQVIKDGLMITEYPYPMSSIREILANAIIHQDIFDSSRYITVEIFDNRIEITNPGDMLIERNRVIDSPPKSRNVHLARLMRRMKMCEEMGTGWDRIIIECEKMFLPSPRLESINSYTKVTILGKISFKEMDREDKIWACYTHACVMHASGQRITNTTLRERFGLGNDAVVAISHLLKQTCDEGLIKCFEKGQKKNQSYIPSWA